MTPPLLLLLIASLSLLIQTRHVEPQYRGIVVPPTDGKCLLRCDVNREDCMARAATRKGDIGDELTLCEIDHDLCCKWC